MPTYTKAYLVILFVIIVALNFVAAETHISNTTLRTVTRPSMVTGLPGAGTTAGTVPLANDPSSNLTSSNSSAAPPKPKPDSFPGNAKLFLSGILPGGVPMYIPDPEPEYYYYDDNANDTTTSSAPGSRYAKRGGMFQCALISASVGIGAYFVGS